LSASLRASPLAALTVADLVERSREAAARRRGLVDFSI